MRFLKYFSALIIMGVTAVTLMTATLAHAQHIFPWPTAECPVRWHRHQGRYRVAMGSQFEGHVIVINIHRSNRNVGMDYLQISQYDQDGRLYAEGETYLPMHASTLRETMRVSSTHQTYMVELNAFTRERSRECDEDGLVMAISFYPVNEYRVAVPRYILIPVE